MPRSGQQWRRVAVVTAAGAFLISACDAGRMPWSSGPVATPTVAAQSSAQQSRPTVEVRRGTITDSIKVVGRVISSQEADLYFRATNRLRGIFTETGQQVKAGQVLAELETGDLLTNIEKQKSAIETAQVKLDQTRAKAVVDDSALQQETLDQAQVGLDQARLALEKLRSGGTEVDVKSAEASLVQAQANVEKARSDLATKVAQLDAKRAELAVLEAGPTPAELTKAQADVEAARINLEKATSGPRPEDVRAAQVKLDQSRTKLAQLRDTPPAAPEELANAELAVRAAEVALEKTRADVGGPQFTPAQREASIRAAELSLQKARNDFDKLKNQEVNAWEVRLAELDVANSEAALQKVQNPAPFDAQAARVQHDRAVATLEQLQKGATEAELATKRAEVAGLELAIESARVTIPSAEAALAAAQAGLESKRRGGTTDFDIRDAELKTQKAQNDLDRARAELNIKRANLDLGRAATQYDIQAAEKEVEKQQIELQRLEANLADARIVAPFDGKITKVNGKPGDNVQAFNPVVSISSPAQLLVQAQINEADMPKLATGQRALVTLDAFPGQVLNGTVRDLPSTVVTQQGVVADKNTKITVDWTRPGAEIGMPARVQIVVQRKDDVLIVPTNAIRTVGKRRFVEYMDGNVKRSRNIEVGISTDVDTEVVSGLEEGMTILAGT